jgi:hypothetical protein
MENQKIKHLSFALGLIVLPGVSLASGFALVE